MKLYAARNGKREILTGTVTEVRPGRGEMVGKAVNVKITGKIWSEKEEQEIDEAVEVAFYDDERIKWTEIIEKMKLQPGATVMILAYNNEGRYSGNRITYTGMYKLPAEGEIRERNVYLGTAILDRMGTSSNGNAYTRVTVPVVTKDPENPEWRTITFWDREDRKMATNASKVFLSKDQLKEGEKYRRAVIICGEEGEYNGRKQYSGYSFETIR